MSEREIVQGQTETKSKKLKKEKSINEAKTEIVIVLNDKLNETLEDLESQDSTDGITDSIKKIFNLFLTNLKCKFVKTKIKSHLLVA